MEDAETARQLLLSAAYVGMPVFRNGELSFATMPTVGQTVILFGKTELLAQRKKSEKP